MALSLGLHFQQVAHSIMWLLIILRILGIRRFYGMMMSAKLISEHTLRGGLLTVRSQLLSTLSMINCSKLLKMQRTQDFVQQALMSGWAISELKSNKLCNLTKCKSKEEIIQSK